MKGLYKIAKRFKIKLAQLDDNEQETQHLNEMSPWEQVQILNEQLSIHDPNSPRINMYNISQSLHDPEELMVWLDEYKKNPKAPLPKGLYLEGVDLKETGQREFFQILKDEGYNNMVCAQYNWDEALDWLLHHPQNTPGPISLQGCSWLDPELTYQMSIGPYNTVIDLHEGDKISPHFNYYLARNPNTNIDTLNSLWDPSDQLMLSYIAQNTNVPPSMLDKIADEITEDSEYNLGSSLIANKNTPESALEKILRFENLIELESIDALIDHPNMSSTTFKMLLNIIKRGRIFRDYTDMTWEAEKRMQNNLYNKIYRNKIYRRTFDI